MGIRKRAGAAAGTNAVFLRKGRLSLAAVFVVTVSLGLLAQGAVGVKRTILSPSYYKGLFLELDIYSYIQDQILDTLNPGWHGGGAGEDADRARSPLIRSAMAGALPPSWLQEETEKVVDAAFALIESDNDRLIFAVSLEERKGLFKEALLEEMLALYPPEMEQLELDPEDAGTFVEELDLPPGLVLIDTARSRTGGAAESLAALRSGMVFFTWIPWVALILGAVIWQFWVGTPAGLKGWGISLAVAALLYLILLQFLSAGFLADLGRSCDLVSLETDLGGDYGSFLERTAVYTRLQLGQDIPYWGKGGLLLAAAGFLLERICRNKEVNIEHD